MVASADFDPRAAQYALNLQSSADGVVVPGGDWLLTAAFARSGHDLVIRGADGVSAIVPDYFAGDTNPPLITDSGARLDGALVETLAGPRAPLQYADLQLAQASDASGAIGRVTAIEGVVQVSRADGSQAQLAAGDAVFLRDVIQAAADGKISIEFVDGTSFALSDGARMTLDELVFNPGGGGNVFSASVLQGTFVFLTGQIAPAGEMNVTTPVGTIGVRGTKVVCKLAVEGQESIITLLVDPDGHVGRVEVTNGAGTRILEQANQATRVVSFFVEPSEPFILSQPELLDLFDEAIRMLDRSNGTSPDNEDQGGSADDPDAGDTAENTDQQLDQAAEALGEFETAAGEPTELPQTFVPLPDFSIPDAASETSFTTVTAGGDIQYASASYGNDSSGGDWQPADTRDTEEASAPPPPPPSPYTVISGGSGDDTLGGGSGQLQVFGNAGNDTLSGGTQADKLDGGDGDDTLDAGPGDDVVQGGGGNDLIIGGSGEGDDQLDGGADIDTVKYQSASQDIDVNLTTGKASGDPLIGSDTLANIENVIGGSGNDTLTGNGVGNVLDGGTGNDTIAGLAGDDTLIGGSGDDELAGGAGNDLLQGGADDDTAVFSGNLSDYTASLIGGQLVLTDQRPGGDGADTLDGVESVKFADQTVSAIDLLGAANEAPTAILLSNDTVAENGAGAIIGTITVLDPDGGDSHTFTLSDDRFQIAGGQLILAPGKSLDFEAEPTVSLEITATDAGGLSHSQTFTIHAADVNEPPSEPVDANAAANQVAENAANGTPVGLTAAAVDPDAGDAITYSLLDDAGGRFAIDANTGVVTVANGGLLNFEAAPSHTITVQASSSGGLASTQDFTINVVNANEPPSDPADLNEAGDQVAENAAAGSLVGITAISSDPDSGDVVTYSLLNDAGGRFAIDANTGVVTVANGGLLNFENATSHQITVQASSSGGLTSSQSFTIAVTNVNEAPATPVDINAVANAVAEGAADGTPVGITVSATDPDAGDTVTYSLLDDAGGRFAIDANTGIVTVADGSLLNVSNAASHEITVLATSNGGLSSSQGFTIAVTNVNEPPSTPVDDNGAANQVAENAANGTAVGLTALSIDPDPSDPVVYSLTDDAGGRFAIDANTGVVTVANGALLDFEAAASHQVTVQASSSGGLSASQTFTIDVTNVNEPPSPILDDDDTGNNVAENAASGTVVGITALAADPDAADPVTYTLTNDAGGRFVIDANTGVVTVADGAQIDFESATSHQISVKASSGGGLSSFENFVVNVGDLNEAPAITSGGGGENAAVAVPENTTAVTVVAAADPDSSDSVTYSIAGGVDGGLFEIDANTGALSFIAAPDFENPGSDGGGQTYEVLVRATDGGGKFDEQLVTVTVEDANEPPSAPVDADDSPDLVAENAVAGTAVGIVAQSFDADSGDTVTYSLTDDAGGRFAIDANTGEVTVANGSLLDFEAATSHQITVQATSSGGLNASQTFTVDLSNVNEAPSTPVDANGAANLVAENAANGTLVGITASSIDPDAGDTVTYSLTDDAGGRFAIDANTGVVSVTDGSLLDFEAAASHQITVLASSNGGLSASQTFTVNVGVANEPPSAPVDVNDVGDQVAENATTGTLVGITAASTDPDLGDVVTYSLTDNAGGRFAIDADTGVVTVANGGLLNFEGATSHQITVQAASSGGLTATQDFTIAVTDVNEAPGTPVDAHAAANAVVENAANGAPVGITVSANDPDAGDTVTYSLTDDAGGRFAIDANTGVVTVTDGGLLDFEAATSHQITVQASSNGGLSSSQSFTITVANVNEAPGAPVDGNGAVNAVAENAATGTPVGITAAATDPDAGDTVTYSLTDDAGGRFAIDANTGVVTVANGTLLNFENATSHQITVQATSSGGLSSTQAFTIAVTDVNEPPSAISDGDAAANSVAENAAAGAGVGITALAVDPDAGDPVTYTLTNDAGGRFAIDANTGVVTVANGGLLDFEAATSHQITVKATSSGGLASFENFVINVGDANEAPSTPVDSNGALNLVAENAPAGTLVGITASSTDPDAGDDITYSLLDDAGGRFAIDPVTGVVSVADGSLLAEGSYDIVVQASSSGGLSASQTFTIGVADGNDGPVLTASTLSVAQGAPDLVHETELLATDSDTPPGQIVYTLTVLPVLGVLLLNGEELGLGQTFTQQDIADGNLQYLTPNAGGDSFTVDITDGANSLLGQTVQVNVVDSGAHTDGDVGVPNVSDPLIVGDTAFGRLNVIGGGEVAAGSGVVLGNNPGVDGIVWVSGTESKLTAGGSGVEVAKAGTGLALVTDGGLIETNRLAIGVEDGAGGNLSLYDGTLRTLGTDNGLFVGVEGVGILQVGPGGLVTGLQMVLGDKSGGIGTATISGAGSAVVISNDDGLFSAPNQDNAGQVVVGNEGVGSLQVLEGGHLEIRAGESANTGTTNPLLAIGHQEGSNGIVTIGGAGTTLELSMTAAADPGDVHDLLRGPGIAIGLLGEGVMVVEDNAAVSLDGDEAFVAVGVGNYLDPGDTTPYPTASLTIATGGKIDIADSAGGQGGLIVGDFQSGTGVVNVIGTGSLLSIDSQGGATIGREGTGTLNVLAGGKVEIASDGLNNLVLGEEATGEGQVTVSGAGSTLSATGLDNAILVGDAGKGDLEVSDGGFVTTLYLAVGRYGEGTATIDGAGSKVVVSNDGGNWSGGDAIYGGWVNVAQHAGSTGSLTIQDGGTLEIRDGVAPNDNKIAPGMQIGGAKYSTGIVEVTGAGSSIDISMSGIADENDEHAYLVGPAIIVGGRGEGTLLVSDQAKIQITGNEAYLDVGLGNSGHPNDPTEYYGGTLVISGGATVEVIDLTGGKGGLLVGDWQGGNGTVTVTGTGSLLAVTSEGGADVGNDGTGELVVAAGGAVTVHSDSFNNLNIGNDDTASGKVLVTGAGSTIITSGLDNTIQVGRYGIGQLDVENGGVVSTLHLEVGRSGTGIVNIDGPGSKIIASNDGGLFSDPYAWEAGFVRVGRNYGSSGEIHITNGGVLEIRPGETVNTDTYGAELQLARYDGSTGIVTVSGAGSAIVLEGKDSAIQVGREGIGSLTVTDGAQVTAGFVQFGREQDGVGVGLVSGAGSKLNAGGFDSGISVGRYGTGTLTIADGGYATTDFVNIGREGTGNGTITVTGAGSALLTAGAESGMNVGRYGSGVLNVTAGGLVQSKDVNIGHFYGGNGTATVSGAGSKLVVEGEDAFLGIGQDGTGQLKVEAGGEVETLWINVGGYGTGELSIDGAGSKVIVSNDSGLFSGPDAGYAGGINVGRDDGSNGTLSVTNGGTLEVRPGQVINTGTTDAEIMVARNAGSSGEVIVDGAGSSITVSGPGSSLIIGREGNGSLSVTNGGVVNAGFIQFGTISGAEGTGLVSGAGSQLNGVTDESLNVGRYGHGVLTVSSGGSVTGTYIHLGRQAGGTGEVVVTGSGSQLIASGSNGGTVSVGRYGVGELTVAAGGLVRGDWMNVGSYAGSVGEVLVTGAGSRFESVDGEMNIGRYGSGTVTVQNGATMGANTVEIGHFAGSDGKALVNGAGSQLVTEGTDNAIQVGREGTGILAVQNGGTVKTLALIVGREGDGTVTIEGAGSAIIVSNDEGLNGGIYAQEAGFVRVARNDGSEGKLEITSGGLLEIRPGLTENTDTVYAGMSVGKESGSSGHVLVSGMGSKIRIYQDAVSPAGLGAFAGAFLNVHADSDLKVTNNGQVTIEGPGSHLGIGGQYAGSSSLEVLSGASILLDGKSGEAGVFVGGGVGSGSVVISGPASTITVNGGTSTIFHVGYAAEASVAVTSAGTLDVGDSGDAITAGVVDHNEVDVQIFSHGTLDGGGGSIVGDLFVDTGSVLRSGDGTVAPMTIQGDFLSYQATIEIDAQGHQWADIYDVSGEAVILDSVFEFSFLSGYLPQDGDNFAFLHAGEGIEIDFNNMQYILHNVTAGGVFAFEVTQNGNDLVFNSSANTIASDGLLYCGSDNADNFSATAGADELYGRDGNDTLSGGAGNDWIVGGYGDDNLDGGADADQFFYDAPWYQTYVATNQLVSASGQTGDLISNFDATVTGGDQFVFNSAQFDVLSGISNLNFSVIATEYNGINGTSADYLDGEASFILDSQNHLIYDDNGTADGYTVIATVDLASGSPPITADNLQAA